MLVMKGGSCGNPPPVPRPAPPFGGKPALYVFKRQKKVTCDSSITFKGIACVGYGSQFTSLCSGVHALAG